MTHAIYTVAACEVVGPYTLRLVFDDDSIQAIDLWPILRGEMYGPLRDLQYFNQVRLDMESGTVVWPNGADFDPAILHDWSSVGEAMTAMASSWEDGRDSVTESTDLYKRGRT
jgi:hypothetical protein